MSTTEKSPHLSGLGLLIVGYSLFQGVGSALMIPPIYILATMYYDDVASRARAFGVISGMGGIGAAAGPLIGGLNRHDVDAIMASKPIHTSQPTSTGPLLPGGSFSPPDSPYVTRKG